MKVLITGANGFIGRNLRLFLKERNDLEVLTYSKNDGKDSLCEKLNAVDFIIHLAGVNRPKDSNEFKTGNTDLTKFIVDYLVENDLHIPMIFSSSIQAELDNEYGRSKKEAEDYILAKYPEGIIFRLHNVFGKYCRPNYNSVVATFCYNIAHKEDIVVNDPKVEISLIYIDDICKTFIEIIDRKITSFDSYNYIGPVQKITLGDLADLIHSFNEDMSSIKVPNTGNEFVKKLFSTYVSYCEISDMILDAKANIDERGSFSELVQTQDSGQFSFSVSKPGITRGNHYHHTKIERFIVVKGKARISLRKIGESDIFSFEVSGEKAQIITIPVGYTHNIINIGDDEMVLLIWCNEIFDKNNPDTYYEEV